MIASPDHICASPYCPAGSSVYIEMVTRGFIVSRISSSWVRTSAMSSGSVVLMSSIPLRSITIAIAVCQSSRIARLPAYCVSQKTS